jgi:hypothetical protein
LGFLRWVDPEQPQPTQGPLDAVWFLPDKWKQVFQTIVGSKAAWRWRDRGLSRTRRSRGRSGSDSRSLDLVSGTRSGRCKEPPAEKGIVLLENRCKLIRLRRKIIKCYFFSNTFCSYSTIIDTPDGRSLRLLANVKCFKLRVVKICTRIPYLCVL